MSNETVRDAFAARTAAMAKVTQARAAEAGAQEIYQSLVRDRCDAEMELTKAEMALAAELNSTP